MAEAQDCVDVGWTCHAPSVMNSTTRDKTKSYAIGEVRLIRRLWHAVWSKAGYGKLVARFVVLAPFTGFTGCWQVQTQLKAVALVRGVK